CFDIFEESSIEALYYGNAGANSIVLKAYAGTSDNGALITSKVTGRAEDGDVPEINKVWEFVEVFFRATDDSEATIRAIFDDGAPNDLGTVVLEAEDVPTLP